MVYYPIRLFLIIWAVFILTAPGWATAESMMAIQTSPQITNPAMTMQPTAIKARVQTVDGKYRLGPGDSININVYSTPEFDQQNLVVRPDGFVTINPLGEVDVAGMDIQTLSDMIAERLKRYLKKPEVSVTIAKFHPAIVYVLGAVHKPGSYEIHGDTDRLDSPSAHLIRGRLTVSNLIANAGGVTQLADLSHVLIRNNDTHVERTVDLLDMLRNGNTSQDLMLSSGDTVTVPVMAGPMDDETAKLVSTSAIAPGSLTVRVIGKVQTPGVYAIPAQAAGINSAIASAHGFNIEANKHDVKVMRLGPNGQMSQFKVDPEKNDFVLRENDVVVVDERNVPIMGRGWDYATRIVTPFLGVGNFANAVLDVFNPRRRWPMVGN
jgi:polysaccharide export outer membrane protein